MGDGSVRFVRDQTATAVLYAMSRMKDGVVTTLD
jgi:hypothetical protein